MSVEMQCFSLNYPSRIRFTFNAMANAHGADLSFRWKEENANKERFFYDANSLDDGFSDLELSLVVHHKLSLHCTRRVEKGKREKTLKTFSSIEL